MISGSEVIDPCPISVAADMMVMVPSGAMLTHGLRAWPRALAGNHGSVGAAAKGDSEGKAGGPDHHLTAGNGGFGLVDMRVHVTPPAPRAQPRARCADRCRNGR